MLTASILPSPNLEPAAAVAWYLLNPLLLAAYPRRIEATAAAVAAEEYEGAALHKLAVDLYNGRNWLRLNTAVEPDAIEEERDLRQLLQSRHLTDGERRDLSRWIHTSRPSEYPWLRKPIEAAIQSRADAALLAAAERVRRATNATIRRASELPAAA